MAFSGAGAVSGASAGAAFGPIGMGVGAVAGGLLGGLGGSDGMSRKKMRSYMNMEEEFASRAFKNRLTDADAMGVHRLYALGQPLHFPEPMPASGGGGSYGGADFSGIGSALEKIKGLSPEERALQLLQIESAKAGVEKDIAQANYWNSEAARNAQSARAVAPASPGAGVVSADVGLRARPDMVKATPSESISSMSRDSGTEAAVGPYFRKSDTGMGFSVYTPSEAVAEGLEATGEVGSLVYGAIPTAAKNIYEAGKYGFGQLKRLYRKSRSSNPKYRGSPTRRGGYAR